MSTSKHWIINYLGKPWESGAQGPDAFDCWSLVRTVQADIYGRTLPIVEVDGLNNDAIANAFSTSNEYANWLLVDTPQEGDCVITKSAPNRPDHVGIWVNVDGGRILQCVYGSGVVAITISATKKLIGQHIEFWRYAR
jgi:cell wall-associated NlpC family hydrolase